MNWSLAILSFCLGFAVVHVYELYREKNFEMLYWLVIVAGLFVATGLEFVRG